ncbi:MAG TPA: DUF5709 domain-containing protein [Gordonia sp. (in: high G+C Gram-positive bacteria)]|uniref:DUF5709 domain-containing protein n=1 Tax=unclassified Gordonia (in: high G+C Gram-positive bacteria) TaxID=2657482 RepID=UPI000FC1D630|nr:MULTISPECIES: DUF5709 domain-containing protein [unclassified Gordonia (in: high G+C Gram-positive bacteria)]RUP41169.1 MAG: hypothetical protein EKK60_01440 [Gordonia sp. (in: high G+C Gram-positive bacteria)]HNP55642.1 DUF5709 domain-containing protein [Gordonia sp. (in: high G+C Gram-positive bacteria)]HRC50764.1 DUF5709 domain-containing protein [Gordonia sp. (in: high G+C Gram-positive bacteria)]
MNDDFDDDGGDYTVEQLQPEDMLADEELGDVLDRGYSPPDRPPHDYDKDNFAHESLDERLAEEVPDIAYDPDSDDDADYPSSDEVGGPRAGRLVGPDEGVMSDDDEQMLGTDVGIDGAGASAEEAAVHVITPEDLL